MYLPPIEFWNDEQILEWIRTRINNREAENLICDYKASLDFDTKGKKELVKDVTGFANNMGGMIIVGISEDPKNPHLPDPTSKGLPKTPGELLRAEQLLLAGSSPTLPALMLRELPWGEKGTEVIYVIHHPKSWLRPHRNEYDRRFYKRQNESTLEMSEEDIAFQYAERRATQISVSSYLKKVDYGRTLVPGTKHACLTIVPLPIRDSLIDFYSESGRQFLNDSLFFHNRGANPWFPCMDGVITHFDLPSPFIAKILPTGTMVYTETADHIVDNGNELNVHHIVETVLDNQVVEFAQKLFRYLPGVEKIHLRAEVTGMGGAKLVAMFDRSVAPAFRTERPEYFSGDVCLDLIVPVKSLLDDPTSIKAKMKDRLANYIGLWSAPHRTI